MNMGLISLKIQDCNSVGPSKKILKQSRIIARSHSSIMALLSLKKFLVKSSEHLKIEDNFMAGPSKNSFKNDYFGRS